MVLMNLHNEYLKGYVVSLCQNLRGGSLTSVEAKYVRLFFCYVYVNKSPVRLCAVLQSVFFSLHM